MRRFVTWLMLLMTWHAGALAAGDIILRATAKPHEAWVGQRVILQIDVLGADGWAQISGFGDVDLPGGYLIRTESQGTRLQDTIDGVAYTGQRYEVSFYPQRAGAIEVPSLPVDVTIKTWGADASQTEQQRHTPAVTINSRLPPGAENIQGLISTSSLAGTQVWEPDVDSLQVGDALKRVVAREAADVSAMAFMPLPSASLPGVGIYPAEPEVEDRSDRGTLTGRRTETVTYVFERAGEAEIPDIALSWWNISKSELETVVLPGRRFDVGPRPLGDAETSGSETLEPFDFRAVALPMIIVPMAGFLLLRFRRILGRHWTAWRRSWKDSEARYFRLAVESIRSADPNAALRDTMKWLDRINDREQPARLHEFLVRYAGPDAQVVADHLMRGISTGERLQNSDQLIDAMRTGRKRWLNAGQQNRSGHLVLPALNNRSSADSGSADNAWRYRSEVRL